VGSTGEGVLAVGRDTVDQDALLLEATCMLLDSVPIIPNPSHVCCRPQIAVGATEVGRIASPTSRRIHYQLAFQFCAQGNSPRLPQPPRYLTTEMC
jgi:hypothetical protein